MSSPIAPTPTREPVRLPSGAVCGPLAPATGFSTMVLHAMTDSGEKQWIAFTRNDRNAPPRMEVLGYTWIIVGCWKDSDDDDAVHYRGGWYGSYARR